VCRIDDYQRDGKLLSQLCHLDDEARRFIAVVDEFYDRNIRLIINAEVDIIELYQGQQLSFEFARCQSRLIEMQQLAY
jgi:cell division protein ZapE